MNIFIYCKSSKEEKLKKNCSNNNKISNWFDTFNVSTNWKPMVEKKYVVIAVILVANPLNVPSNDYLVLSNFDNWACVVMVIVERWKVFGRKILIKGGKTKIMRVRYERSNGSEYEYDSTVKRYEVYAQVTTVMSLFKRMKWCRECREKEKANEKVEWTCCDG